MSTWFARNEDVQDGTIPRDWFVVDAEGQTLGRLATRIATVLRGRHKAVYTPHVDVGDFVVVINAEKIKLTANKMKDKVYHWHTGYLGGIRSITAGDLLEKEPTALIEKAVKGMLPRGPLGRSMFKKLKAYVGPEHPHTAQSPKTLDLSAR